MRPRRRLPPRAGQTVLSWLVPPGAARDALVGDLEEEYVRRFRVRGAADAWYWRQVLSLALHYGWARLSAAPRPAGDARAAARRAPRLDALRQDVRFAARLLRRQPGFTCLTVVALAIGIGGSTAMFSVVRAVALRPLPYGDPGRLVLVWTSTDESPRGRGAFSPPDVIALRERSRLLADVAAVNSFGASVTDGAEPEQLQLGVVTANFFSVLGVRPLLGRDFTPADDTPMDTRDARNTSVIILSHALWRRRFGADPGVIGRTVRVGGAPMTVVGVLSEDFRLHMPSGAEMSTDLAAWTPLRIDYASAPRTGAYLKVVGRLRPGVRLAQAQAELDAIAGQFRSELGAHEAAGLRLRAAPMHAEVVGHVTPMLTALAATVGFLLLIACANVANLLLARLAARERELAVRAALGGSRGRIVRQLLSESTLLALLGALAGIAVAWAGVRLLLLLEPAELPRVDTVAIDAPVLGFTLLVAALATLLFGLAPAVLSSRTNLAGALRDRAGSSGSAWRQLRNALAVAEVALSLVLLVGAGLMLRSVLTLRRADLGFRPEGVLTFRVSLPFTAYREPEQWTAFYRALGERLERLPGVEAVGAVSSLPASGTLDLDTYALDPARETQPWGSRTAAYRVVSPGFFDALRVPLRAGRALAREDDVAAPLVVVVDEALARGAWPGESPVGARVEIAMQSFDRGYRVERRLAEVVGVVATVPHDRPDAAPPGTIYVSHAQQRLWTMAVAVRAAGDPLALGPLVRREVRVLDPELPVHAMRSLDQVVAETLASTRFVLLMLAIFAGTALVLAAVGLYGVIAYLVRQRTSEFAVRLALGARPRQIAWGVVRSAARLGAAGIAAGAVAAAWLAPTLDDLLVGVSPRDPLTLGGVAVVVLLVVGAASYWPARRAAALDPAEALR